MWTEAVVPLSRGMNGGLTTGRSVTTVFNGDVYGFDEFERKVVEAVIYTSLAGGLEGVLVVN